MFVYVVHNEEQHTIEKHDAVTSYMIAIETGSVVVEMHTHEKEANKKAA